MHPFYYLYDVCELTLFNMSRNYKDASGKVECHIWGIFIQLNLLYITNHGHFSPCTNKSCSFNLCIKDILYSYLNWQRFYGLKLVLGLHRFKVYSEFVKMLKKTHEICTNLTKIKCRLTSNPAILTKEFECQKKSCSTS